MSVLVFLWCLGVECLTTVDFFFLKDSYSIIEPISRKCIVPRLAASAQYSNCLHIKTKR